MADHILVAAAYSAGCPRMDIYNVCSSARHPMTWRLAKECVREYWNNNPSSSRVSKATPIFVKSDRLYNAANGLRKFPVQVFKRVADTVGSKSMKI